MSTRRSYPPELAYYGVHAQERDAEGVARAAGVCRSQEEPQRVRRAQFPLGVPRQLLDRSLRLPAQHRDLSGEEHVVGVPLACDGGRCEAFETSRGDQRVEALPEGIEAAFSPWVDPGDGDSEHEGEAAEAHGVQGEERQLCACAHALPVVIVVPAEEEREALELRIAGEVSAHCVWAE